ncbi:MAG: hypothetical protein JSS56_06170 [Proteobacteria bacterium]|nr:hypothetical protein [Pseudomonadota bacterium]
MTERFELFFGRDICGRFHVRMYLAFGAFGTQGDRVSSLQSRPSGARCGMMAA